MSADEPEAPHPHDKKYIAFERANVILALVSLIVGAVAGWVVSKLFDRPNELQFWLLTAAVIMTTVSAAAGLAYVNIQRTETRQHLSQINNQVRSMSNANVELKTLVEQAIEHQAELIPRERVYRDMAKSIRAARREVSIITYLMADWEKGERTFLPADKETPHRKEFYDAVYEAIKNPKIEYLRIWGIPHDRRANALDMIRRDQFNAKECDLIEKVSEARPHVARLIIADQLTTASFILIDRECLFLNIDFFDPKANKWHSPYMLFIKDTRGEAFTDLQGVIVRLSTPG